MTTAETVRDKAISLARADTSTEEAIQELLGCCTERRVPVVLARQHLEGQQSDPVLDRAAELLDGVLERLPLS